MKARDVSFFKKNAWKGTYSSILTIPVESLSDKCFGAWLDIEDTNFAEATLPDEKLADFVGQPDTAFVHNINIRRILYRSGLLN